MKIVALFLLLLATLLAKSIPQGYITPMAHDILLPKQIQSHFGVLEFDDGIPTKPTQEKIANEKLYIDLIQLYKQYQKAISLWLLFENLETNRLYYIKEPNSKLLIPNLDPSYSYLFAKLSFDTQLFLQTPSTLTSIKLLNSWAQPVAMLDANSSYCLGVFSDQNETAPLIADTNLSDTNSSFEVLEQNSTLFVENDTNSTTISCQADHNVSTPTSLYLLMQLPKDSNISQLQAMLYDHNQTEPLLLDTTLTYADALVPRSIRAFIILHAIEHSSKTPQKIKQDLARVGIEKERKFLPSLQKQKVYQKAALSASLFYKPTPIFPSNAQKIRLTHDITQKQLNGSKSYKLHIPETLKNFSIALYDPQTQTLLQNPLDLTPYLLIQNYDGSNITISSELSEDPYHLVSAANKNFYIIVRSDDSNISLDTITIEDIANSAHDLEEFIVY